MVIQFECPSCDRKMTAPDKMSGKQVRCPQCKFTIDVPVAVYEAEEVPPPNYQPAPPPPPPVPSPVKQSEEPQEERGRRPCPMCGEMIITFAAKCRYCGEILDPALRSASSPYLQSYLDGQMNGLGWIWIFVGSMALCTGMLIGSADEPVAQEVKTLMAFVCLLSIVWLGVGILTCMKQLWAVYVGLVLSYLSALGYLLNLGQGGGDPGYTCGLGFGLLLMIVAIVQSHRVISMSGRLKRRF